MEESDQDYGSINRKGLELVLDYNEDRSSVRLEDNHAQIHIETVGKLKLMPFLEQLDHHLKFFCILIYFLKPFQKFPQKEANVG